MTGAYDWEDYVEICGRISSRGDSGGVYVSWTEIPRLIEELRRLLSDHNAKQGQSG